MKLFNKTTYKGGFTLIELLIYSSILVVVLAFTAEYLFSIGQARINNTARVEVTQNAQVIINKLKKDLQETDTILVPSDSIPTDLLYILGEDFNINYHLEDNTLIRYYNSEEENLSSNQVQVNDLIFQKVGNEEGKTTIQAKFTLTSKAQLSGGRNVSENFQTTISQR